MDKLLTVNQKKASKQPKNKKKPVKVVYITNPIKFKTSASEFRSLVQELTGQDADMPEYSPRFVEDNDVGDRTEVADAVKVVEDHAPSEVVPTVIVDNFQELVPSNQWHETTHFDGLKS
ncbi:Hypothetical predicted protein [Olea europaea subsp. europaea]|uniref:VQ domain-containing protein n=1 Tax=Olea europaea subsp. europaea TaxID=158383 RepID=A0A8S0UYZ0_OLEEU|nr:Hypothetical predicted protein [Olea europaea subsp. europaea]